MKIDVELVKEIREKTGLSVMECKKALEEANGVKEKALDILKKRGLVISEKKAIRETKEGLIGAYIHTNGKVGVLIEVNTESDFVARNEEFKELVKNLALQIAALAPKWVDRKSIPCDIIEQQKKIYMEQFSDKPAAVVEKIVEGKMDDFYKENVLMDQPYIKDESITVKEYINSKITKLGENIQVRRFVRYEIGK